MPAVALAVSRPTHAASCVVGVVVLLVTLLPVGVARAEPAVDHLVVSEVVTGGASASDELIELYNPTAAALPLEGLEVVYVSATGATVSRRTAWALGAPSVPPAGHVLIANTGGMFAAIADATYASGMASTGGSVAIRIQGASSAIDAVGWGTAASAWLEAMPAAAPATGSSIERLPGGALGSTTDTDDNHADFVERAVPQPQNLASPPTPDPGAPPPTVAPTIAPTAAPTVEPTPAPPDPPATPVPTPMLTPAPPNPAMPIALARAAADGSAVTIEGTTLTATDFHDGGGFVADRSGGIAVIVDGGSFARGALVRITGTVDDRFAQRTIRADAASVAVIGASPDPSPILLPTGGIGEATEGALVRVHGALLGAASVLTTGVAFDLDDGSGATRLVVGVGTGIDTTGWGSGTQLELIGVVGQRDSSGTGIAGYRVMPRDPADVLSVGSAPDVTPTPSPSSSGPPTPEPSALPAGVLTIAQARQAPKNAKVRVQGVVTLATGVVDPRTAAVQDRTGAILLRLGDEAGSLSLGARVDVSGSRSTKSGMETVRVTQPPVVIGSGADPVATALRTGAASDADEARLVTVSGAVAKNARRSSSGSVSLDLDDGSGPLKVVLGGGLGADAGSYPAGTWLEVTGVLGQETTGAQPDRGYRVWPRRMADVRIIAGRTNGSTGPVGGGGSGSGAPMSSLSQVGSDDLGELRIGATLVVGPWPELGVGGLLWDGVHLVAIDPASSAVLRVALGQRRPPVALELGGLSPAGVDPRLDVVRVRLGREPGEIIVGSGPLAPPLASVDHVTRPAWASVVGHTDGTPGAAVALADLRVEIDLRCAGGGAIPPGAIGVTGIAIGEPVRLVVPCGGIVRAPEVAWSPAGPVAHGGAITASADVPTGLDPRAPVAATLLCLAAVVLLVAGVAVRRLGGSPVAEAEADIDADADGTTGGPRLRLVPAPHERGS